MANGDKVTESRDLQPVVVAVPAIDDASKMPAKTVAKTEGEHVPNFVVKAMAPVKVLGIRFAYLFFKSLSGSYVGAEASGALGYALIPHSAEGELFGKAVMLALGIALGGLFIDMATIFGRLEKKYPELNV